MQTYFVWCLIISHPRFPDPIVIAGRLRRLATADRLSRENPPADLFQLLTVARWNLILSRESTIVIAFLGLVEVERCSDQFRLVDFVYFDSLFAFYIYKGFWPYVYVTKKKYKQLANTFSFVLLVLQFVNFVKSLRLCTVRKKFGSAHLYLFVPSPHRFGLQPHATFSFQDIHSFP